MSSVEFDRNVKKICTTVVAFSASVYPSIGVAEARVSTTANRMAGDIGWEQLWLILLFGLFVVYPLLMRFVFFVIAKRSGLTGLNRFKWMILTFVVAGMGLLVAFLLFIFILLGSIFVYMNIDPVVFYLCYLFLLVLMSYSLIKKAVTEET